MSVFISYRHSDFALAISINKRLRDANIETYLDKLDAESQTTDDITSVITRNIARSTHLIAVVSSQTAQSWWVPFEIGEATILGRRISSYQNGFLSLPEYLSKWPQMKSAEHLELFISAYQRDLFENVTAGMEAYSTSGAAGRSLESDRSAADEFHRNLTKNILHSR
ncbi:toll/interleukin-1 receptor domain-containing protein [Klebsiella michiganensis]|uniref:toll/interleukin-1 receptor domain-containing protein n=1 Tax=Klebsiella michiganensis TaxID=1134687 RepID=UPI00062C0D51|nr:toll/interleukin-1 receptor domain-containing protein [Klebsiella michiganensis]KKY74717.1 molecular chaperone Tir [Klebsiella michiganensis]